MRAAGETNGANLIVYRFANMVSIVQAELYGREGTSKTKSDLGETVDRLVCLVTAWQVDAQGASLRSTILGERGAYLHSFELLLAIHSRIVENPTNIAIFEKSERTIAVVALKALGSLNTDVDPLCAAQDK